MSLLIIVVALIYCIGYLGSLLLVLRWMGEQIRVHDLMPETPILALTGLIVCGTLTVVMNLFYPLAVLYYSAKVLSDI